MPGAPNCLLSGARGASVVEENLLVEMRDIFSKINRAEWWGEGTKMERLYLLNAPLLEQKKTK